LSLTQPTTKHMHSMAWSADDKLLATIGGRDYLGKDLIVTVWDTATGKPISTSEAHRFGSWGFATCAFTADGKHIVLAHSGDGTVKVLDAATCEEKQTIEPDEGARQGDGLPASVAVSADGQYVVRRGVDGSLTVLDVPKGKARVTLKDVGDVGR